MKPCLNVLVTYFYYSLYEQCVFFMPVLIDEESIMSYLCP